MSSAGRCTGHCCKRFFLPYSPGELARAEAARAAGEDFWKTDAGVDLGIPQDISIISGMVLYLEPAEAVSVSGLEPGHPGHHYTCRHLLGSGDCAIYASRPTMCRDYPYGKQCSFSECTMPNRGLS